MQGQYTNCSSQSRVQSPANAEIYSEDAHEAIGLQLYLVMGSAASLNSCENSPEVVEYLRRGLARISALVKSRLPFEDASELESLIGSGKASKQEDFVRLWEKIAAKCDPWQGRTYTEVTSALDNSDPTCVSIEEFGSFDHNSGNISALSVDAADSDEVTGISSCQVVHLVCDNSTINFSSLIDGALPFLRSLSLSGCNFVALPNSMHVAGPMTFFGSTCLMVLDLSYMSPEDIQSIPLDALSQTLRKLSLEGCELECLPASLCSLKYLEDLVASDNMIETVDSISVLSELSGTLKRLDMRDNPVVCESAYASFAATLVMLEWRDGRGFQSKGKAVSNLRLDAVDGLKEAMLSKDTVADVNEDRGSCSCGGAHASQSTPAKIGRIDLKLPSA